jgi:hypothetical protein
MPRKTLKQIKVEQQGQKKQVTDTDSNVNRVRSVAENLIGNEDPDDLMLELLDVLEESGKIPSVGKFYIFVYRPKTPNIKYDQNPLVAVTDIFKWGFRGINFHWGETRQYTLDEIPGSIYEVYKSELKDLEIIPFAKMRINN